MPRASRYQRCPADVLGWIPRYLTGVTSGSGEGNGLDHEQRAAVDAHARRCADCRAELAMLAGRPIEIDAELPDADRVFARIVARIAEREPKGPRRR